MHDEYFRSLLNTAVEERNIFLEADGTIVKLGLNLNLNRQMKLIRKV